MNRVRLLLLVALIGLPSAALAAPEVGDPAPPFTLQGSDGKSYTLDSFKGEREFVFAWFPKAFTPG